MKEIVSKQRTDGRIKSLDVLRGFSLLGILLVNMISFHSPFGYYNPYEWWEYGDRTVFSWIDILVQASFYPIFAMMFGYGITIMYEKMRKQNMPFYKINIRRLLILLMFGVVHAFLIWHGDILITYALMGLLLLIFIRQSGRTLILTGILLYLIPMSLLSAVSLLSPLTDYTDIVGLQYSAQTYATGSFAEIIKQRFLDWYASNGVAGFFMYIFMILPLMMIGAGAGKLHWLQKVRDNRKKWLAVLLIFLPIGLLFKYLPLFFGYSLSVQVAQDLMGGPLLAVAYIAIIVLLTSYHKLERFFKPFASAGRMSLTVYLTQSIIGTLIFYQYGLGLYGKVSMSTGTWLAIAIYIIQLIVADMWLGKFRQGPMENLWRKLTYGKKYQNMHQDRAEAGKL